MTTNGNYKFPETVLDLVAKAVADHPADIEAATQAALRAIRRLPDYAELIDRLVYKSVRELVYDNRHVENVRAKRLTDFYAERGRRKVGPASPEMEEAYKSLYDYYIAGQTLGSLLGVQLAGIAASERRVAAGHEFNAALCEELDALVPDDRYVRDAVPEKRLRVIFQRLQRNVKHQTA